MLIDLGGQAPFHIVLLEKRCCRTHLCMTRSFFFFWKKKPSSLCVLSFCVTLEGLPRRVRQPINWSNTAGAGNFWAPWEFETPPLPPSPIIMTFLGKSWTSTGYRKGFQANLILFLKWKETLDGHLKHIYDFLQNYPFKQNILKHFLKSFLWGSIKNNYWNIFYRNEN